MTATLDKKLKAILNRKSRKVQPAALDTIKKALAYYEEGGGWTTGKFYRNKQGEFCTASKAVACCAAGILYMQTEDNLFVIPHPTDLAIDVLTVLVGQRGYHTLATFNDAQKSVEPIKELFREGIAVFERVAKK